MKYDEFASFVRSVANNAREIAGYSGAHHDGGASRLTDIIDAWEAGRRNEIPECLKCYMTDFERQSDPEYREYIRLQKKFGR